MDAKKYGQQYALPEDRDQFVDVEQGHVVEKKDVPPLEVIKALAARYKMDISKPNTGCRHCYGRGYTGTDVATGAPVPCNCLFRGRDAKKRFEDAQAGQVYNRWNHDQRRKMKKAMSKLRKRPSNISANLEQKRLSMDVTETNPTVNIFESKTEPPEANFSAAGIMGISNG